MAVMRQNRRRLALIAAAATAALASGLVSVLPATAAADGRIQYAGAADAVKDSYIVTLKADSKAG